MCCTPVALQVEICPVQFDWRLLIGRASAEGKMVKFWTVPESVAEWTGSVPVYIHHSEQGCVAPINQSALRLLGSRPAATAAGSRDVRRERASVKHKHVSVRCVSK